MITSKNRALVILSGGQDSTTCLFWAIERFAEVFAITVDYGQRHRAEIKAATIVAQMAGIGNRHEIIIVPDILVSASPLTNNAAELEQYTDAESMAKVIGDRVELTFVPMRNMFFFTLAMNRAVALGCDHLVTGICQEDNANYPDCRDSFRHLFEKTANYALGTEHRIGVSEDMDHEPRFQIHAPLMHKSKAETCQMAHEMPECWRALRFTHTSYDGKYPPTDMNHANVLRAAGFEAAGLPDPLVMRAWREGLMELPASNNYDLVRKGNILKTLY
jgi:7-cyano-7-deazaguanine synthase